MDGPRSDVPLLSGELCRVGRAPVSAPEQLCPLAGEAPRPTDMSLLDCSSEITTKSKNNNNNNNKALTWKTRHFM